MKKRRVALIVETSSDYGRRILRGIAKYLASHHHWSVFLEQRDLTSRLPEWLPSWKGDGIISRFTTPQLLKIVDRSGIAFVDVTDRRPAADHPLVWSDHLEIGRIAAEHFLERAFENFAFAGFSDEHWSALRLEAYRRRLEGHDVHVFQSAWYGPEAPSWDRLRHDLSDWIAGLPKPVAIFAGNDVRGLHVLDACNNIGASVPEEVAVLGVDNEHLLCDLCDPPMSSIIPNAELIGHEAAAMLDRLMDGDSPESIHRFIPPLGIETRQSTDIYAIPDPDIAAAARFIRENACSGITVADVLKHVPLSRSVLERRFRKYLKRSPQKEIRQVQIKRIRQLLTETDLSLEQIAEIAGFTHPEYMHVVFKRETGQTPGEYRSAAQVGQRPPLRDA
ncbi:DNA-binding transcriptional regulator [Thermostilla marina]